MDEDLEEEKNTEELQKDLDVATNNWKRALADFENYKRRKELENKELLDFAKEVTVAKLLPTLDSLEQALRHMPQLANQPVSESAGQPTSRLADSQFPQQYQNWQAGINVLVIQLDKTLEELGVRKIFALGKKFDPHFHEAVREVESEQDDGIVVEELQTGFELNGKVIRPSQVVISKKVVSS
jgi:molecular chaperone GrpE